ncbi:hypothetical protein EJ03DRAFT_365913 [Teratosphaeria nubilosa]|uniref:Uncharacterized protein n=1 Tax=Teratosphaeria nubilosa TaxID=161662 RepID=A0A6G1LJR2_9PEZI|nr:hypothetical protein EJ03DRAFT_365913 [Teratosphaeria nubilosa]
MRRFTGQLGRGIKAIKRNPKQRPAKLREFSRDILEDQQTPAQSLCSRSSSSGLRSSIGSQESDNTFQETTTRDPHVGGVLEIDLSSRSALPTIDAQTAEYNLAHIDPPPETTMAGDGIVFHPSSEVYDALPVEDPSEQPANGFQYGSQEEYEQVLRGQTYIHFYEEEESDYVPGPARLILASDGSFLVAGKCKRNSPRQQMCYCEYDDDLQDYKCYKDKPCGCEDDLKSD